MNYIIPGILPSTLRAGFAVQKRSRRFCRMGDALLGWFTTDFEVNKKAPRLREGLFHLIGSLAVNYSRMASATLPSSQLRFTSEFGMESGGSTALLPPGKNCFYVFIKQAR